MRVEWGDRGVSINPQNTLPHVESIRNNLVFYPPLQKKGGFSEALCVCVCVNVCAPTHTHLQGVRKERELRKLVFLKT